MGFQRIGIKTLSRFWSERTSRKLPWRRVQRRGSSSNSVPHGVDIANSWPLSGTNSRRNSRTMKTLSSPRWTLLLTKLKTSKFNHSPLSNSSKKERSSTTKVAEPSKTSRSSSTPTANLKTAEPPKNPSPPTTRSFPQDQTRTKTSQNQRPPRTNFRQLFKDFIGDFLNFVCVVGLRVVCGGTGKCARGRRKSIPN